MTTQLEALREEVRSNKAAIRAALDGGSPLVYVNGTLYLGHTCFDSYKGVGWQNGRPARVELGPEVPHDAWVTLVSLSFGRLRRCERPTDGHWWRVVEEPEDRG